MTSQFGPGVTVELSGGKPLPEQSPPALSAAPLLTKMEDGGEADFTGRQRFCGGSTLGLIPL